MLFSIFVLIAQKALAEILQVNFTGLVPSFASYDTDPYFDPTIHQENIMYLTINDSEHIDIYVNSVLYSSLDFSGTIPLILSNGFNIITIQDSSSTDFIIPYSTCTDTHHTITIGSTVCGSYDCGTTTSTSLTFSTTISGYSIKLFSTTKRKTSWTSVSSSLTLQLAYGTNYLQVLYSTCAMVYKIYKTPDNSMLTDLELLNINAYFLPRFAPDYYVYIVSPKLDSIIGLIYSLKSVCQSSNDIVISSSTGQYADVTAKSGAVISGLTVAYPSDVVIIKGKDNSGKISYYYLSLEVKNRNRYLEELRIYQGIADNMTSYDQVTLCCNLPEIITVETFSDLVIHYTIAPFDYMTSPFSYMLVPEDLNAQVFINGSEYLASSKSLGVMIGNNHIEILVIAEDPGFNETYTLDFVMKNNDSTLLEFNAVGDLQPVFSSSTLVYRLYIDYYIQEITLEFIASDSKSNITIDDSYSLYSNISIANYTIPLLQLTQSISVKVYAETISLYTEYSFTIIKNDACGNGLRFSTAEQCDDGNNISNDGCDSFCMIENGYTCSGGSENSKDICKLIEDPANNNTNNNETTSVCGNGIVEQNEQCDNPKDNYCVNCIIVPPVCGNGILEKGEECDDGNLISSDGCSKCKKDSNGQICGDGLRYSSSSEKCDDGNSIPNDGCTNCTIDKEWTCTNTSLITNINPKPDTCTKTNSTIPSKNNTDPSNNATNHTIDNNKSEISISTYKDSGFEYVGTVTFFIACVSFISLFAVFAFNLSSKTTIGILPGLIFPLWVFQIIYCFKSASSDHPNYFSSFAWAHLQFYKPVKINKRSTLDIIGLDNNPGVLFIENLQYFWFIIFFIGFSHIICRFIISRSLLYKIFTFVYLTYYLASAIPVIYFAGISLVKPDFSSIQNTFSFCIAPCVLIFYISVLVFLKVSLKNNTISSESSDILKFMTKGLKVKKVVILLKIDRKPKNDEEKDKESESKSENGNESDMDPPKIVVESHSFDEDLNNSDGEAYTSAHRNLDKTDAKIRSEPISVYKYKSPEKSPTAEIEKSAFPYLYTSELGFFLFISFILASLQDFLIVSCSIVLFVLLSFIVFMIYKSPFEYIIYRVLHVFCPVLLVILVGFLFKDKTVGVYYVIIVLVFGILCAFIGQFADVFNEWMTSEPQEVREFAMPNLEPSVSYVRDSIPEERAPESATINHLSYDVSVSDVRLSIANYQ
ncbi:hypothetical protein SteCoe_717 [Stentor coeruleus]|uniref:Cadherin-like beta sandwich domain-containing protein n=1 Tax=Stentor coeruleus TaxID=5963 RepID=A0A1R2D3M2_9CILI|nr:hypothetical protein SteCoe_717 [Stentor coeruleus]